jgi:hypothetical protein
MNGNKVTLSNCQNCDEIEVESISTPGCRPDFGVLDQLLPGSEVRLSGALISYSEDAKLQIVTCSTATDLILPS